MDRTLSLVTQEQEPELFGDLDIGAELLEAPEVQAKRFTAQRVALNQGRYRAIVRALGQDLPVRMISEAFGVSHHTVKKIREREPALVATEKKRFSLLLGHAARLSVESYIEDVVAGKVPANVKSVGAAIFLDKKALIDGEATSRIEHLRSDLPSLEEMRRAIENLPAIDCQSVVKREESQ